MFIQPKILVWDALLKLQKKCQKQGSGISRTFFRSPVKSKLKMIETSNMAQNDCHVFLMSYVMTPNTCSQHYETQFSAFFGSFSHLRPKFLVE